MNRPAGMTTASCSRPRDTAECPPLVPGSHGPGLFWATTHAGFPGWMVDPTEEHGDRRASIASGGIPPQPSRPIRTGPSWVNLP